MDRESQPWLHGFELSRRSFLIVDQPLELIAKVDELLSTQGCAVLAVPWSRGDLDPGGQPVSVPVVGFVRVLPRHHLDRDVLRVIADVKGKAHGSAKG